MVNLTFAKDSKEYKIFAGEQEVGRMYKDSKRNYQFAIVAEWNFKVKGYRNETSGKTYKAVKADAQKMYNQLMKHVADGHELIKG